MISHLLNKCLGFLVGGSKTCKKHLSVFLFAVFSLWKFESQNFFTNFFTKLMDHSTKAKFFPLTLSCLYHITGLYEKIQKTYVNQLSFIVFSLKYPFWPKYILYIVNFLKWVPFTYLGRSQESGTYKTLTLHAFWIK